MLPDERVIFKTRPHWLFVVVPEAVLAVLGFIAFRYFPPFWPAGIPVFGLLTLLFGVALGFLMTVIFLDWLCTNYYLTSLRLVEERGIIGKRIMSIWLERVQDVVCRFGILGRIFGFGDIEIESAGTKGKIVFSNLPSPRRLTGEIEEGVHDLRVNSRGV